MCYIRNKIILAFIFFILGIVYTPHMPLSDSILLWLLAVLFIIMRLSLRSSFFLLAYSAFVFSTAVFLTATVTGQRPAGISTQWNNAWVTVRGIVTDYGRIRDENTKRRRLSFTIQTTEVTIGYIRHAMHRRMIVTWYGGAQQPRIGDRVTVRGKGVLPRKATNVGEFDYRGYLAGENIFFLISAFGEKAVRIVGRERGLWYTIAGAVERYRCRVRKQLNEHCKNATVRAIMQALLIGDRTAVSPAVRDAFVRTGTLHLLAISGMHISIIAVFFFAFFRLVRLPGMLSGVLTLFLLAGYALLSGYHIPVIRACATAAVYFLVRCAKRENNFTLATAFVGLLMLIYYPLNLYRVSFQLSFITVMSISWLMPLWHPSPGAKKERALFDTSFRGVSRFWIYRGSRGAVRLMQTSVVALLGAFPVLVWHFNSISLSGIAVNCIAIPLVGCILLFGIGYVLTAVTPGALLFLPALKMLVGLLYTVIASVGSHSVLFVAARTPTMVSTGIYYAGMAGIRVLSGRLPWVRKCALSLLGILALVFLLWLQDMPLINSAAWGKCCVSVFDAKKTLMAYARFPDGKTLAINTGMGYPFRHTERILVPYLLYAGIRRLDCLACLSYAKRNWGGISYLAGIYMPHYCLAPRNRGELQKAVSNVPQGDRFLDCTYFVKPGDVFFSTAHDGYHIDVPAASYEGFSLRLRMDSVMIMIFADERFFVFDEVSAATNTHIYLVAERCLTEEFLRKVQNGNKRVYVVVSGRIPPEVRADLPAFSGAVFSTQHQGMISFVVENNTVAVKTFGKNIL